MNEPATTATDTPDAQVDQNNLVHLNQYIEVMHARGARSLVFECRKPATVMVDNQPFRISDQLLPFSAVESLLRASADKETVRDLLQTGEASYTYRHPNASYYKVKAAKSACWLCLTFQPIAREVKKVEEAAAPDEQHLAAAAAPAPDIEFAPYNSSQEDRAEMENLFSQMVSAGASDLHLSNGCKPYLRVDGTMRLVKGYETLSEERLKGLLFSITPPSNQKEFDADGDTDFAYEIPDVARFRCNLFQDKEGMGGVFRQIPNKILTAQDLKLTPEVMDLCNLTKGLVIVTGPTGSGKSTTLAALVDHINANRKDHIITIEDPIEFVHKNKRCLVNQREVPTHTRTFKSALRAALREDPDVILVGEMRDLETVEIAIETAETGHLVFGTLHTTTAPSTIDRVIDQFPADRQGQIRAMLSESLSAVIAQVLCKKKEGGRAAAQEVLFNTTAVANLIREGKTFQIPSIMQTSKGAGMVTLNQSLLRLVCDDLIEPHEAYLKAVDKHGLLKLFKSKQITYDP